MSGFGICFTSVICLLVFLTGRGSALHRHSQRPSYPSSPNDPYYKAFQNVPSADVTAKKFMTNFLRIPSWSISPNRRTKRDPPTPPAEIEDIVVVMDGSGSVAACEFNKGRKALKYMMMMDNHKSADMKYAAVTFATTAKVNFKFLPYSTAARKILKISAYPYGGTNTQAGLAEAKKLFDDPSSGRRNNPTYKSVFLVTDGQSRIQTHLTIPNAQALKDNNVKIFVVAVGYYISGIDELVKVASYPPDQHIFRVETNSGFLDFVKKVVKEVNFSKWVIISKNYDPPC